MELVAQGGGLEPPACTFGAGEGSFEIAPGVGCVARGTGPDGARAKVAQAPGDTRRGRGIRPQAVEAAACIEEPAGARIDRGQECRRQKSRGALGARRAAGVLDSLSERGRCRELVEVELDLGELQIGFSRPIGLAVGEQQATRLGKRLARRGAIAAGCRGESPRSRSE